VARARRPPGSRLAHADRRGDRAPAARRPDADRDGAAGARPHPDPGLRIVAEPAALAQALAAREPSRLRLDDPAQREAFAAIVGGLREHWRVAVRWEPAEGAAPGRVLEVVDSDAGYWVVVPDAAHVELWPTTPTDVFRALGQLFPLTAEMAAWTPS
jgi:hypothetical protein